MTAVIPVDPKARRAAAGIVLEVNDLHVGTSRKELVHGVSFALEAGKSVGIVGESGSGKTMTAMAVAGLLPAGVRATGGSICVDGREAIDRNGRLRRQLLRDDFGVVFQNPTVSLNPRLTIGDQLHEALADDVRRDRRASARRAVELLDHVGIARPQERLRAYPHELSGGLNQRAVIAIAIARSPRILIADEATTALDVSVQRQVLDLIDRLRRELQLGVIIVSHDIGVIADRADDVLVMQNGETVEQGPTTRVLHQPAEAYTQSLLAAVPRIDGPLPRRSATVAPPVIEASKIVREFHVPGHRSRKNVAVDGVDLTLREGEALGIVGESGSGKTTLARILVGLDRGYTGDLTAFGQPVRAAHSMARVRRQLRDIQYVFQDPYSSLDPRQTVAEIIAEPIELSGTREQKARKKALVSELMEDVRLPQEFATRKPHQLSGGQRQRTVIARALALDPKVLVADEPVSALDLSVQKRILDLLDALREERNLSYVVISHDLGVIRRLCTDVVVMRDGVVVERGTTESIFSDPHDPYTRLLLEAIPGATWLDASPTSTLKVSNS